MEEIVQNDLETSIVCKANKQDHKERGQTLPQQGETHLNNVPQAPFLDTKNEAINEQHMEKRKKKPQRIKYSKAAQDKRENILV